MISQDTGSAIIGPARADLYWGAGDAAGRIAGRIRHQGRFTMLIPRELDMVEAGKKMPLPPEKPPPQPEAEAKKDGEKGANGKNAAAENAGDKKPAATPRKQAQPVAKARPKPRS
jgi:membrane-bound lytic murein transglycosylase A